MIKLREIADSISMTSDETEYFYYVPEEKIVCIMEDDGRGIDWEKEYSPEELAEMDEVDRLVYDLECSEPGIFIALPSRYEVNEYSIMEDFIISLKAGEVKDSLWSAIRGRGAFRRFKDKAFDYGLLDRWYAYQEKRYNEIAIEWCKRYGIVYETDD